MPMFAAAISSAVLSVAAAVRRQVSVFRNWREARQGYALLCEMDERTLADLGLTRSDIRDASTAGLFGDPTSIVAARASERQGRRSPSPAPVTGPSIVPDVAAALPRAVPCM